MAEYYYLVSSLPMLMPDMEPLISSQEFMEQCSDWLNAGEMNTLETLRLIPEVASDDACGTVPALWNDWETNLRNRLAKNRADTGQDAEGVQREEQQVYGEIEQGVMEACNQNDPQEKEKTLDNLRWSFLNDLEGAHQFDFDTLCVYKLKLLLREKWTPRTVSTGRAKFDEIVAAVEEDRQGETSFAHAE